MASSRNPQSRNDVVERVDAVLAAHVPANARLTLGLSGGIDSIVLLDVLAGLRAQRVFHLSCVHVHHGISSNADQWAEFAQRSAQRYGVECALRKVRLDCHAGLGLEGAARAARYGAFSDSESDFVVFAHHRDDQAETLLLQLVRGAGVSGLAAMPVVRPLHKRQARPHLLRPMLDVSRAEIETYAQIHGLKWVEDESNSDVSLARNLMRHRVMPLLNTLNTAATSNIARAAMHLADAAALLDTIARTDLAAAADGGGLNLAALQAIGETRARNALRAWLAQHGVPAPTTTELREALRQLYAAEQDAVPLIDFGARVLRRFRNRAYLVVKAPPVPHTYVERWRGDVNWPLPALGGCLHFEPTTGAGIAAHVLQPASTAVRLRQGGESFQPDAHRPRRTLKNLMQEHALAPWLRDRLPLLYCNGVLAFVPGIGCAAEFHARAGEAGVLIRWESMIDDPERH